MLPSPPPQLRASLGTALHSVLPEGRDGVGLCAPTLQCPAQGLALGRRPVAGRNRVELRASNPGLPCPFPSRTETAFHKAEACSEATIHGRHRAPLAGLPPAACMHTRCSGDPTFEFSAGWGRRKAKPWKRSSSPPLRSRLCPQRHLVTYINPLLL